MIPQRDQVFADPSPAPQGNFDVLFPDDLRNQNFTEKHAFRT